MSIDLGLIMPDGWGEMPLGYIFGIVGGGTPSKDKLAYWTGAIPWASPKDFNGGLISSTEDSISEAAVRESSTRIVPRDSILVVVRSGILKHSIPVALTATAIALNQDVKAFIPRRAVETRYYRYFVDGWQLLLLHKWRSFGATVESLDSERMKSTLLPVPPLPTQRAIADFLDRKTAAIDALIEKKQKLLDLLAEKRTALINRAVTKGLDPDVPIKDSGVAWIGEIPAHWEVKRLKYVADFVTSGPRGWGQYYSDTGPLFLRITNIDRGSIELLLSDDKKQSVSPPSSADGQRTLVCAGDVLITITADIGSVGVVPDSVVEAYVSQHIALCRPSGALQPELLAYVVLSTCGRLHYELSMNGGTKVGLTLDDVRSTPIFVPPRDEQDNLLAHMQRSVMANKSATRITVVQIEKLQEYRQALITAAVTGQIDVEAA